MPRLLRGSGDCVACSSGLLSGQTYMEAARIKMVDQVFWEINLQIWISYNGCLNNKPALANMP